MHSTELYDEEAAGRYLGGSRPIPVRTLQRYRQTGDGPEFVKIGRHVRYTREALDRYLAARTRSSTSAAQCEHV